MSSEILMFEDAIAKRSKDGERDVIASYQAWFADLNLAGGPASLFTDTTVTALLERIAQKVLPETDGLKFVVGASAQTYWRVIVQEVPDINDESFQQVVVAVASRLFYATARPERFAIFNNLSASEMCFVEADSLFLEAVSHVNVRWDAVQSLQVTFIVERILQRLLVRDARVYVIAFAAHAAFYRDVPQLALVRELVLQRLESRAEPSNFIFKRFDAWWDSGKHSFFELMDRLSPEFVMLNDCEQLVGLCPKEYSVTPQLDASPAVGEVAAPFVSQVLRYFAAAVVAKRTHVVYTSRLVFKDNDAVAFVIRANSSRFVPLDRLHQTIHANAKEEWKQLVASGSSSSRGAAAATDDADTNEGLLDIGAAAQKIQAHEEKTELKATTKDYVILPAIANTLRTIASTGDDAALAKVLPLAKAHVIAHVMGNQLPLSARALPRVPAPPVLKEYLDQTAKAAVPLAASVDQELQPDEKFADAFDGGLIAAIAAVLVNTDEDAVGELLGEDVEFEAASWWQFAYKSAGLKKLPLLPLELTKVLQLAVPVPAPTPDRSAKGLRHPLVRHLLNRLKEEADEPAAVNLPLEHPSDDTTLPNPALEPNEDFAVLDVPCGVFKEEEEMRRYDQMTIKQQKIYKKTAARYVSSLEKTAESMDVKPFLSANEGLNVLQTSHAEGDLPASKAWAKAASKRDKAKRGLSDKERMRKQNLIHRACRGAADGLRDLNALLANVRRVLQHKADGEKDFDDQFGMLDRFVQMCSVSKIGEDGEESGDDATFSERDPAMFAAVMGEVPEAEFVLGGYGQHKASKDPSEDAFKAIDAYIKAQQLLAKKKDASALLDEADDDAALRLKSMFFDRFVAHLRFRAMMESLRLARCIWTEEVAAAKDSDRPTEVEKMVPMFQRLQKVLTHIQKTHITALNQDRRELREVAVLTGLGELYEHLIDEFDNANEGAKYRVEKALEGINRPNLGPSHTPARFQMNCMGHLLERPISKADDKRVPFNPDPWQVDLLDIVDRNGSAVVCAPTSAGKTFISYYCMKKVLRESNENIVVYVCPTRALINQALSDVYGRYGMKKYNTAGMQVFGCLGGAEYVKRPFKCQVLITLPETFEAILLAARFQNWAKRIKYVIFDEIHSIEDTGNGAVWERLLMLVRCPFVALSATLGATEPMLNWLNGVQSKLAAQATPAEAQDRDFHVQLVPKLGTKINRWSDIQKYAYLPTKVHPLVTTTKCADTSGMVAVHPMSAVTLEMLRHKFPDDLPFVPRETLHVYDELVSVYASILKPNLGGGKLDHFIKDELRRLKPERYFDNKRYLTQSEARGYEAELKTLLQQLGRCSSGDFSVVPGGMDDEDEDEAVRQQRTVITALKTLLAGYESNLREVEAEGGRIAAKPGAELAFPDTSQYVHQHTLTLLTVLRLKKLMPTLVFSFQESDCSELVEAVVTQLETAEAAYRSTKKFKDFEAMMQRKRAEQDAVLARMEKGVGKVRNTDEDGNVEVRTDEIKTVDSVKDYTIPDVLPEFSFKSGFERVSAEEMTDIEFDLKRDNLAFRAFQRGIGMHSPALKGKLRVHVERLFRLKVLPVVFATDGLALGVHSPCRSVVLAGDHPRLSTSQFRQMAGRAGRRGLDFLGHVIFLGVAQSKIQRLLTSDLPTLKGHVHIDPSVELRLQQLYDFEPDPTKKKDEQPVDRDLVSKTVDCLMTKPLFYQGNLACNDKYAGLQVLHMATTLRVLADFGLVHKTIPSSLGCLATRVMHTFMDVHGGNEAIMFSILVSRGFFHNLTAPWSTLTDARTAVYETLLKSLCYFLTRDHDNNMPLDVHRSVFTDPKVFSPAYPELGHDVPHEVVLPGVKLIDGHRFHTHLMEVSKHMVTAYSDTLAIVADSLPKDVSLPFAPNKKKTPCAKSLGDSPLAAKIEALSAKGVKVRSAFMALNGSGDRFSCIEDFLFSIRDGLFLDPAHIPWVDFRDAFSHRGDQMLINSAIPDFIDEGSQYEGGAPRRVLLEKLNGLGQDKSWYTLDRFMVLMVNTVRAFQSEEDPFQPFPSLLPEIKEDSAATAEGGVAAKPSAKDPKHDTLHDVLEEVQLQIERRGQEIGKKYVQRNAITDAAPTQQTQKKAKRPALAREQRRRR